MKFVNPFGEKGYLYLMQYKHTQKHKIGISHNVWARVKTIREGYEEGDEGVEGVHVVDFVKVWDPAKHEAWLHEKWSSERFTFRGSGKTEWFRFNWLELFLVWCDFRWAVFLEYLTLLAYVLGVILTVFLCFLLL